MATSSDQVKASLISTGTFIVNTLVRCTRGTIENVTHGVLALTHAGSKQTLPPIENDLLLQSATALAAKIRRGEVLSEDLIKAYIKRIEDVNPILNAAVDTRFAEALEEAQAADRLVKSCQMTEDELAHQFPLLGVPFTAKEAVLIKGLSSTSGLVNRKGLTADEDSEAVARLRACGGIPLAVTNTSEICMWWETYNKLHGQTNNPYDTTRTVGGSSGGEAALIAAAGSLIGLGTDLGGSIRLPSFFNGIFGHKPSQGLVPHGGQYPPALDEVSPYVVTGPIARYASDLRLALAALVGKDVANSLRLHDPVDLSQLKVYYLLDDGGHPAQTPVSPEIKESIQKVVDSLSTKGIPIEEVKLPNFELGFIIWCACLSSIKEQRISQIMSGRTDNKDEADEQEPLHQEVWKWLSGRSQHTFPILLNACAQDHLAPLLTRPLNFFSRCGAKLKGALNQILSEEGSVLLCPTFPTVATYHGQIIATPNNVGYSVVFNAMALPSTQCPLGLNPSGLPFGMQVVTGHNNDRYSIAVAEYIEAKFGGWHCPC